MKFRGVLMCKDDFYRLDKTLESFYQYNPQIPIVVFNCGGKSPELITSKYNLVTLRNEEDIWNRGYSYSFTYKWFDFLFEDAENYDYTIFLETDVKTLRKIKNDDVSSDFVGHFGGCSPNDVYLYKKFGIPQPYIHTGAAGTFYSKDYFIKCKPNLNFVKEYFEKERNNFYQDLAATFLARKSGCSLGYSWDKTILKGERTSNNTIFIHQWKW